MHVRGLGEYYASLLAARTPPERALKPLPVSSIADAGLSGVLARYAQSCRTGCTTTNHASGAHKLPDSTKPTDKHTSQSGSPAGCAPRMREAMRSG